MTEDEKAGWNHRLNGHEFVQIPGDGDAAIKRNAFESSSEVDETRACYKE